MRCPHCRGEIPPESQFCGVCGQSILASSPQIAPLQPAPQRVVDDLPPSLFDLPVSRGARLLRTAMILGLNLLLIGGGVALFLEYLDKRAEARGASQVAKAPTASAVSDAGAKRLDPVRVEQSDRDAGVVVVPSETDGRGDERRERADAGTRNASGTSSSGKGASDERRSQRADAGLADTRGKGASDETDDGPQDPFPRRRADAGTASADSDESAEAPSVDINVLAKQITLIVRRNQAQLGRCYQNAAKGQGPRDPLAGRVDVRFRVMPDGSAADTRVVQNSTGSDGLGRCLVDLVNSWTFPSPGGEAVDFVWPFEFQAPK